MQFSLTVLTVELTTMYCHLLVIVILCISLKSNLIKSIEYQTRRVVQTTCMYVCMYVCICIYMTMLKMENQQFLLLTAAQSCDFVSLINIITITRSYDVTL